MAQPTHPQHQDSVAFGVTSLVTGIVAFFVGFIPWFSIPLGTIAIVFGALGLKKPSSKGMSIAGLITGGLGAMAGLALALFWLFIIIASVATPTR